jgi:protein-S-isoprenylcysteine O-methyltransferase Ste14
MMGKKLMPTTYLMIAMLLSIGLHFLVPLSYVVPSPWNLIGLVPMAFGIWINLSADHAFKMAHTTVKPFEESSALLQDDAYRYSRNPMYLGFESILLGIALLLGSLSPYLVVILFPFAIERSFIHAEESMLEAKFGEEWRQYKSRVRKWL